MTSPAGAGPRPPADLDQRRLPTFEVAAGSALYRIHRTRLAPLHFGKSPDPARRQRWDSPDARYGVCYVAAHSHLAFAETMLRDLQLNAISAADLELRSLARILVREPLRLAELNGRHLHALGADASIVHGAYQLTWDWSAAIHDHPGGPDGIRYRARHDDSGFSVALFERAQSKVLCTHSVSLRNPSVAAELATWLDRYGLALTA